MADDIDPQSGAPEDAAAEAFEQLRAEVAHVRAALNELGPVLRSVAAPDYSPTLGAMAESLEAIEAHPALQHSPELFASQLRHSIDVAQQQAGRELTKAVHRVDAATADLKRLAAGERNGREQNQWLMIMAGGGLVTGALLWACLSGPVARALPEAWHLPEKMAAATLNMDQWDAGARLMRTADPSSWSGLAMATSHWRNNSDALERCGRAATKTGKAQRCVVKLDPPNQPR